MSSRDFKKIVPQLKDDLENFDLIANLSKFKLDRSINIKRVFYRSITLFVSALGRLHGLRQNSSFSIIAELRRRNKLSQQAAHKLAHSVAVACHIRLSHYSSKQRQADNIHNDDEEIGGKKKLKALTRIVSKTWLIKSLVAAHTLQGILEKNSDISEFDDNLNQFKIILPMWFLGLMGLHEDVIRSGERLFKNLSNVTIYDYHGLRDLCMAYISTNQYEKCLDLIKRFKNKLPKLPMLERLNFNEEERKYAETLEEYKKLASLPFYDDLEHYFIVAEAQCLFYLRGYEPAMKKTDFILQKPNLHPAMRIQSLKYNSLSKINLGKYHEALSAIRDLFKFYQTEKNWVRGTMSPDTMGYISLCLIKVGRRRQGIHWAREGLNYVIHIQAVEMFLDKFMNLIRQVTTLSADELNVRIH